MALIAGNSYYYDRTLHVGSGRISPLFAAYTGPRDDMVVSADGHELEKIKQQFSGIPMTTNRTVVWMGNDAWFIINNLIL